MIDFRTRFRTLKKTDLIWSYYFNFGPTLSYAAGEKALSNAEKQLVTELNETGVVRTSVASVIDAARFDDLSRSVGALLVKKAEKIAETKLNASKEGSIGQKTFNLEMLGSEPTFDVKKSLARFALNESFLRIANAYFRMVAKLRYYNVWFTAASASAFRESQLWHFDREDNYILKVFLYLDDVDEGTGPFTYAPGTHRKGRYRSLKPEFFDEGGVKRTTDDQMAAVYPREKWKVCTGKKGTIIFADTRGYHKGGEARTKDRLMYTCMFTSPASESKQLIKFPDDLCLDGLTPRQRKALYL